MGNPSPPRLPRIPSAVGLWAGERVDACTYPSPGGPSPALHSCREGTSHLEFPAPLTWPHLPTCPLQEVPIGHWESNLPSATMCQKPLLHLNSSSSHPIAASFLHPEWGASSWRRPGLVPGHAARQCQASPPGAADSGVGGPFSYYHARLRDAGSGSRLLG